MWVDSEVGRGAVFTIYLPQALDDVVVPEAFLPETPSGGSETLLLVEDEDAVRSLAKRVLVNQGYTVLEAANGHEALELVANTDAAFDLVLTDVIMPHLGGPELVSELRQRRPDLRVLYMSGYTHADKLMPALPDPTFAFLQKPFSPENLARKIRESLDTVVSASS